MKRESCFLFGKMFCLAAAAAILSSVLAGCESSDGTESPVEVTPETVTLSAGGGNNVILTASGGLAPYRWTVSDATLGRVNASGEVAVYTRTAANGINLVTATDTNGFLGRATIYQSVAP
jgi:hypothetical protein